MEWTFENYTYLFLLLLLPVLGLVIFRFRKWRNKKRALFAEPQFHQQLFSTKNNYFYLFVLLYFATIICLVLAFADLSRGGKKQKVEHQGTNIVFLLDLSNSMNAEDVSPSRIEREKSLVLQTLQELKGDKVGMVIFAGDAFSVLPLTTDYSAISTYVDGLSTQTITYQGTDFLPAVQEVAALYQSTANQGRNVVLIGDGEDNEGHDQEAVAFAKKHHLKIISVGIGTEEGAPVPDYVFGQMMGYKRNFYGDIVISKRQTRALKNLAESTGGSYIDGNENNASTKIVSAISRLEHSAAIEIDARTLTHYYQWFLGGAIIFIFIIYLTNPKKDFNI